MMAGIDLFPHQLDAVGRLTTGSILCGGVGSGKSRTALAYYYICHDGELGTDEYVPMDDPPRDLYIITTARKRDTLEWEGELSPFLLSTNPATNLYHNKVIVDSWNNIKKYTDISNAFFIFDEQRVVGNGTWVKSFLKIAKNNAWILLSATPGDTWQDYIPVFIANGFYRNRTEFVREHVVYKRYSKYPQIERYLDTRRLERLRDSILVNMEFKRHTIAHHEDVFVSYDTQRYKELIRSRWNPWEDKPVESAGEFCYGLRKIINSDVSRKAAVLKILESHPRAIIFYNFDYELEILKNLAHDYDILAAQWNGHVHQPVPESEKWIYLVQYNAGAEGWNCVKTDTMIFYSQTYSYKTLVQACGRIDRLNTLHQDLYYYHLKSHAGIDLAIARTLKAKKDFYPIRFKERKKEK